MGVSLKILLDEIVDYNLSTFISGKADVYFRGVKLLEKNQSFFDPDYLYIGKAMLIPKSFPLNTGVNILCITKSNSGLSYYCKKNNLNLIVLQGDVDVTIIFNILQDLFLKQEQVLLNSNRLLDVLFQGKGIQDILDTAYELIGNPLILVDASYKLLGCTKNIETTDPYWNELVTDGYFSYDSMSYLRTHRTHELINKSDTPIFFDKDKFEIPRIISRLMIDNKFVGQLCVMEHEKPLSEKDMDFFSVVCGIVTCELQKQKSVLNTKGMIYESFITDLLDGRIREIGTVRERMRYLDMPLKENMYVLTVTTLYITEGDNVSPQYIRTMLEQIIVGSKSVIYNDNIVLILSRNEELTPQHSDITGVLEFLKKNKIHGGLSRCFHNLTELQDYYQQSMKAITYGMQMNPGKFLFMYEDYSLYYLLDLCSLHKNLENFCHISLFKLMENDSIHNTNLTQTLFAYLNNSKRLVETANELKIHRNTLNSRLEAIQSIMSINLDDSNLALQLLVSFQILRFLGKVDFA